MTEGKYPINEQMRSATIPSRIAKNPESDVK